MNHRLPAVISAGVVAAVLLAGCSSSSSSGGQSSSASASSTGYPVYPVYAGGGTTGSASLATSGLVSITFDSGGCADGDFVTQNATAATAHDAGSTAPTSGRLAQNFLRPLGITSR